MRKRFTIMLAASMMLISACDSQKPDSSSEAHKVEKEVWGDTDSGEQSGDAPITLTYAILGYIPKEEKELIEQFNEDDNGYVIETRDYSSYVADEYGNILVTDDNLEKFKTLDIVLMQDIANGEIDIFRDLYLNGAEKMDMYANKGAFADLYQFMKDDPDVNTSTLNEHILQLHETDGKLYILPTFYYVDTLIGQTRYVGDKENWTLDEFISHWNPLSDVAKINGHRTKNYVYYTIMRQTIDSYIDYKKAAVYFDSPEFIRALEYCNTFDDIAEYYEEFDYNAIKFVEHGSIRGFAEFHTNVLWNPENQPVTLVGYPSESGSGAYISTIGDRYAISAGIPEEKQKGAWEFIKTFAMEEPQKKLYCNFVDAYIDGEIQKYYNGAKGFPINLKAYDALAKDAMAGKHMKSTVSMSGVEHEVGLLTQDELDRLTAYINSVQNLSIAIDDDLWNIIDDEILGYFAGEKTVEQTIEAIQDRAGIMVSEKQ